jgi:hypothetical protein
MPIASRPARAEIVRGAPEVVRLFARSADITVKVDAVPLDRETRSSDDVRAPSVPRGKAVMVTRYGAGNVKVALVNPEDLSMLEESHDLLHKLGEMEPLPVTDLALKALALEDRPDPDERVEDPERIAAILDL